MNNIYRESREAYIIIGNKHYTIEQAAHELKIDYKTLQSYETDSSKTPPPNLVYDMSILYHDPSLRRVYCSNMCEIGSTDQVYKKSHSLYTSGYRLIDANTKLSKVRDLLFNILADGIVDDDEKVVLEKEIPELIKEVKGVLCEIEVEIEKQDY